MPVYQTADDFYAVLRAGFGELAADPRTLADFQRRRMTVQIRTTNPETITVIDGKAAPAAFSFGAASTRVDLSLVLPADLFHSILLGETGVRAAFTSGNVQVDGSIFRALQLADLFRQIQRVYPRIWQAQRAAASDD